jgi:leucyl aminopeptidase
MTGYIGKRSEEHIGVVNDFVDEDLTKFVTKLIDSYADLTYSLTKCGLVLQLKIT